MRLFLKHLMRSIRIRAKQPFVLILTLLLSTLVSIFALTINEMIEEEMIGLKASKYGSSDIEISLNAETKSRFMFASDVGEILNVESKAVGCFDLVGFYGDKKEGIFCCATEFSTVSEIFDLRLSEAEKIPEASLTDRILVSRDFATENHLSLGDTIEIEIGGVKKSYRISGISHGRFMSSYDILLDIVGVMRIYTSKSPILSALGDSFKPSSAIYIDLPDGCDLDKCVSLLYESDKFGDKQILKSEEQINNFDDVKALNAPMIIAVILSSILAAAVAFTCFYILSLQRTEENESFSFAGAKRRILVASQYIEVLLYWLFGGGVGLLLSVFTVKWIAPLAGYEFAKGTVSFKNALISLSLLLLVLFATVTLFTVTSSPKRRKNKGKVANKYNTPFAILLTLVCISLYFIHIFTQLRNNVLVFILAVIVSLFCVFIWIPHIFTVILKAISRRCDRRLLCSGKPSHPSFIYAAKNLFSLKIMKNTARLFVVLLGLLLSIITVICSYLGGVKSTKGMLEGDFAVLGATEKSYDKLSDCSTVEGISRLYFSRYEYENKIITSLLSTDNISCLSEGIRPTSLPAGNEIIISRSHAAMLDKRVGDNLTLCLNGRDITFVVKETVSSSSPFAIINADYAELSYNMLILDSSSGTDNDEAFEEIANALALEMTTVISPYELLEEHYKSVETFINSGVVLLIVVTIFVLIGLINNLVESYRARSEEFSLYRLGGMSNSSVLRMKGFELLITFGFGAVFGIALFVLEYFSVRAFLFSYGIDIYSGVLDFFK